MIDLCLACASAPLPSEKPTVWHRTPCCDRAICTVCIRRRPRLARYCLVCQRGIDLSASASTSDATDGFVIGDDEDEIYDEKLWLGEPPAYEATQRVRCDEKRDDEKGGETEKEKVVEETDPATRLYYISATDTLVGIAFAHGITPRQLAAYNKLPPAALTITPSLIHTRQFLILPPNAKRSASPIPLRSPEEEHRRLLLRRFQVASKCADASIAKIYLDAVFLEREKERECILENRRRRRVGDTEEESLPIRQGGEVEDAVARFEEDQRWEVKERKAGRRPPSLSRKI